MDNRKLKELLEKVKSGDCAVDEALNSLKHLPSEALEFACVDHHRHLRTGFPEVVFGENKSAGQIVAIMEKLLAGESAALATRVDPAKAAAVLTRLPELTYHDEARMLVGNLQKVKPVGRGSIAVVAAGTSDIPVAEEALITARSLGNEVEKLYDVGVAGIHRLFAKREILDRATVLIVVAGMEGALPSVIGGLVDKPVIAVPTSIGYGTGLGGIAALLGMLNSCAPGMAVVNIDNGFGAGCMASAINRI
ncbi:MAG: nickel pincer cofactor biosynthesis protein LarB [Desulfurivibrionaceae bacterium]|nr:nickel pincer cofactor biosynthesis protein LarB [Desulfobulbales bacterium]MDT8335394.1 nickel pincer cofactor biosynthesis protein LarB [Desulfurivibrionaceae bacterium]